MEREEWRRQQENVPRQQQTRQERPERVDTYQQLKLEQQQLQEEMARLQAAERDAEVERQRRQLQPQPQSQQRLPQTANLNQSSATSPTISDSTAVRKGTSLIQ